MPLHEVTLFTDLLPLIQCPSQIHVCVCLVDSGCLLSPCCQGVETASTQNSQFLLFCLGVFEEVGKHLTLVDDCCECLSRGWVDGSVHKVFTV